MSHVRRELGSEEMSKDVEPGMKRCLLCQQLVHVLALDCHHKIAWPGPVRKTDTICNMCSRYCDHCRRYYDPRHEHDEDKCFECDDPAYITSAHESRR